jgi:non-canonical purine NTP pyrophosphatase (RdgB/HAM1 family)
MKPVIFITGNQRKVDYLAKWLELPLHHHKLDLDEIQSLDTRTVAEHKARQAYAILKEPVLVEDTSLVFTAMGRLPGTMVKWFLEEIGTEGLCKLAGGLAHRKAVATVTYAYCDGEKVHFFEGSTEGLVAPQPRGENGMGWDPTFIPNGSEQTFAEMPDNEKKRFSPRAKATKLLRAFLLKRAG